MSVLLYDENRRVEMILQVHGLIHSFCFLFFGKVGGWVGGFLGFIKSVTILSIKNTEGRYKGV